MAQRIQRLSPGVDATKCQAVRHAARYHGTEAVAYGIAVGSGVVYAAKVGIEARQSAVIYDQVSSKAINVLVIDRQVMRFRPGIVHLKNKVPLQFLLQAEGPFLPPCPFLFCESIFS